MPHVNHTYDNDQRWLNMPWMIQVTDNSVGELFWFLIGTERLSPEPLLLLLLVLICFPRFIKVPAFFFSKLILWFCPPVFLHLLVLTDIGFALKGPTLSLSESLWELTTVTLFPSALCFRSEMLNQQTFFWPVRWSFLIYPLRLSNTIDT